MTRYDKRGHRLPSRPAKPTGAEALKALITAGAARKAPKLPREAYLVHPEDGRLIMIRRDVSGYYPIIRDKDDARTNQELADVLNGGPLAPEVAEAMRAGSMFGWGCPAADPANYVPGTDRWKARE